jgi:hypothetical protein
MSSATEISAPSTGNTEGAWKCSWSTDSRRSTSTATFTIVNTVSSSTTVVSASVDRSPVEISTTAIAVVKMIAATGVRRPGSVREKSRATMPWSAIP